MTEIFSNQDKDIIIHKQYLMDMSFENREHLDFLELQEAPENNVSLDIMVNGFNNNFYEVVLDVEVKLTAKDKQVKDKQIFLISLFYAGLVSFETEKSEEEKKHNLLVEVPTLLFPFARNIIAEVSALGGYPPLYLPLVNFEALYQKNKDNLPLDK